MKHSKRFLILGSVCLVGLALLVKIFLGSIYRLPILMYHSIDYTLDKKDRMIVSPEAFAKQMKFLNDKRYNVIPLEKAVWYIKESKKPPPKTVAITIDDGYENNYMNVFPVLKKYGIPATIFVITKMIGKEGFLTLGQIKEMSRSGLVDIESHTKSHFWLTGLDDDTLREEAEGSKKILEGILGKGVNYICYPMGAYNERVKNAVKKCGYKAAFATKPTRLGPNYDVYEIKRVRISSTSDNLCVFFIKLSGYHAFFRVIQNDYKDIPYLIWKRRSSS